MLKTYLQLVNNVLTRLREPEVSSVGDTEYSKLIGIFVNDAKREIEDAYKWSSLEKTIIVPTVANQREYTLTGSGRRFNVDNILNDTEDVMMQQVSGDFMDRQYFLSEVQTAAPIYYNFSGMDNNGDTLVEVWPSPDSVYQLRFMLYVPTEDLELSADTVRIPSHLVQMLAHAKAVAERGEDGGQSFAELYQMYRLALADAIALESNRYDEQVTWMGN